MGEQIFEKIKQFVDDEGWGYGISFNRETKIEADLGITGDDAAEYMINFGKQFNVDVSKFVIDNYFFGEGETSLINQLIQEIGSFLFKNDGQITSKKQLTLGDLEKGVIAGKLDETVINTHHT